MIACFLHSILFFLLCLWLKTENSNVNIDNIHMPYPPRLGRSLSLLPLRPEILELVVFIFDTPFAYDLTLMLKERTVMQKKLFSRLQAPRACKKNYFQDYRPHLHL